MLAGPGSAWASPVSDEVPADEEIRAGSVLPALRRPITFTTSDGVRLIGEVAVPVGRPAVATLVCVHPLPTHGGMMDSHLLRKAAWRLPALADIAVVRFNTRGTASAAGVSDGAFDASDGEGEDLDSVVDWVRHAGLPDPWLLGWSFGSDVVLRHGVHLQPAGVILVSPSLRYTSPEEVRRWNELTCPMLCLVPEHDDVLGPKEARERLAVIARVQIEVGRGAVHLWVGEAYVKMVLDAVVARLAPDRAPLPGTWSADRALREGPMERWSDL